MKRLMRTRRRFVIEVIAVAVAFILGFCAHSLWTRRRQIIDVWNNLSLYYQDGPMEEGFTLINYRANLTDAAFCLGEFIMALIFHAADVLFRVGIVILICLGVVLVFSTLARRLDEKMKKRHKSASKSFRTRKAQVRTHRRL